MFSQQQIPAVAGAKAPADEPYPRPGHSGVAAVVRATAG